MFKPLFTLLFSTFLAFAGAQIAVAADVAPDFAQIPAGLKAHYQDSTGERWTVVYLGKRGNYYVSENRDAKGKLSRRSFYNMKGHEVRREFTNGSKQVFAPQHCGRVMGKCSYQFTDTDGKVENGTATLRKWGKSYRYRWKSGSGNWHAVTFQLANYGILGSMKLESGRSYKLVALEK